MSYLILGKFVAVIIMFYSYLKKEHLKKNQNSVDISTTTTWRFFCLSNKDFAKIESLFIIMNDCTKEKSSNSLVLN